MMIRSAMSGLIRGHHAVIKADEVEDTFAFQTRALAL
jgi:hypothetical protein